METQALGEQPGAAGFARVGPYRLLQQLGEGGMGVVHLALDPAGKAVAIKVLRPHIAADPASRTRLAREVETLSRIRHPNVAPIVDHDVTGDLPYVVTRYIAGPGLDQVIEADGPLRGPALLQFGRGLAAALHAIHEAGVVHRDVKPANILLLDGEPILIDFGIAHVADDVRLTRTGLVMGTPGYLSPEIVEGAEVTESTDWWGWAATLGFAAQGRPPFGRGSMETILSRVVRGDADLAGVDPALVPLLEAALSVEPEDRPTDAEVLRALERYTQGRDVTEVLRAPRREVPATQVIAPAATAVLPPVAAAPSRPVAPAPRPAGSSLPYSIPDDIDAEYAARRPVAPPPGRPAAAPGYAAPARTPYVTPAAGAPAPAGYAAPDRNPYAAQSAGPTPAVPATPPSWDQRVQAQAPAYEGSHGAWDATESQGAEPGQPQRPLPPRPAMAGDPRIGRATRGGLLAALAAALITGAASHPAAALGAGLLVSILARTADRSVTSLVLRRHTKGQRSSDLALAILASPLHLLTGTIATLAAALIPAAVGLAGVFATLLGLNLANLALPGSTNYSAALAIGMALTLMMAWWGPGGAGLRRGTRSLARGLAPGPAANQIVTGLLLAAAVGLAAWALLGTDVPVWWPWTNVPSIFSTLSTGP